MIDSPIPIGILHSTHGTMAISETSLRDVVLMEIDRVNAEGGLLGRQLQPIALDPASDWMAYRDLAHDLIHKHDAQVIFGCWTSSSRKSVLPVVEEADRLLFYPVQYEGEELSRNLFYFGATPNQQAIPAIEHLITSSGGGFERFYFLGTDYVYPRTTNRVLKLFLEAKGFDVSTFPERYVPFGHNQWNDEIERIRAFSTEGRGAIVSTLNGDTNLSFYRAFREAGFPVVELPIMAFSISEAELQVLDPQDIVGHLACCSYFMSAPAPENAAFITRWQQRSDAPRPVYDAMVATLIGFRMWCKAVTAAGTTATGAVRQYMYGQSELSLTGKPCTMGVNHHLNLSTFVGRANDQRSFDIVWESARPIPGDPFAAATIIADTRAAHAQRALLEALPTPLLVVGDDSEVQYRSPSTHRYFGTTIEKAQILEIRAAASTSGGGQQADLQVRDHRGRSYHMTAALRQMMFEGKTSYLVSLADVTHIREIEERLRVVNGELHLLATTDPLTNISNRRHFLESVLAAIDTLRAQERPAAMFMLDVDIFKHVNDRFGHDAGDQVLLEIVTAMRHTLRAHDFFGRLGGDEFAGLLSDVDTTQAFTVLERLRSKLAAVRLSRGDEVISFTTSIGMTTIRDDDTFEAALKRADTALYQAKETGRNRVFISAE